MQTEFDITIIGAGPAGLSAAINGGSEGFRIGIIDSGPEPGGQALRSSRIENYPGFPRGVSGQVLMGNFLQQAGKFRTDILCPQVATSLRQDGNRRIITTDEGDEIVSKIVILTSGLSYRRLDAPGVPQLLGRGILYGAPTYDPTSLGDCTIGIIGGANSAGQAAMHLSRNHHARIYLLVRKKIGDQMSQYLIDRIQGRSNIQVIEGVEVTEAKGDRKLHEVVLRNSADNTTRHLPLNHLCVFIGAQPKTLWLNGSVHMDPKGFIVTGHELMGLDKWNLPRQPDHYETSMPGVFACGDVRLGSIKRIASAVGEGSVVIPMCHKYCRTLHES